MNGCHSDYHHNLGLFTSKKIVCKLGARLSTGEVEVLPNAVKSYGAISEKVNFESHLSPYNKISSRYSFFFTIPASESDISRQYSLMGPSWPEGMG